MSKDFGELDLIKVKKVCSVSRNPFKKRYKKLITHTLATTTLQTPSSSQKTLLNLSSALENYETFYK